MQFYLGAIIPALGSVTPTCRCYHPSRVGTGRPGMADLRGRHDMCCSANNKLPGHNDVLEAMAKCLRRIGISTSRTTVLVHARRSDRNGNPDPTDQSKKQPDLAIYDTHSGGSLPTLLDLVITYPTAPSYLQPSRQTSLRLGTAANQREHAADADDDAAAADAAAAAAAAS